MSDYEIVETTAENIGGCSLCRYKHVSNLGYRRKLDWLKQCYAEGLRYKVLRSDKFGEVGMIEYALGNQAWRAVEAEGYLVIYDGKVIADRPVSGTRFWFIMRNMAASRANG